MALPDYEVVEDYTGNGGTTAYTFDFTIEDLTHLLVVSATAANVITQRVRGDDVSFLSNVDFDPDNGGGTVHLLAPLPTGHKLRLILANDEPVQLSQFKNKSDFTLKRIEDALDYQAGALQRAAYLAQRGVRLSDFDAPAGFDMEIPPGLPGSADLVPVTNTDGDGWAPPSEWLSGSDLRAAASLASGSGILVAPTDGIFGVPGGGASGTAGSISGVDVDDTIPDAFDKVEAILEKLAPARPPNLSATLLQITGSYSAREATTGTLRTVVIDDTTPTIQTATAFGDGASGDLEGTIDAVSAGSITLSASDDTGSNGDLQITSDVDYYAGISGRENFWFVLQARINRAVALATGSHTAELTHSATGTATLNFSVDDPVAPSISSVGPLTGSGTSALISGVPALRTGATVTATFEVQDAVKSHYNAVRIASALLPGGVAVNAALPGVAPAPNAFITAVIPLPVLATNYSEDIVATVRGYNSKDVLASSTLTGGIRVDAVSDETNRYKSGTGQYPAQGVGAADFGAAWVAATLLSTNKELQMLNGLYQYPPLVDYTGNLPTAGPDYSGLTADAYASMRWVTFKLPAPLSSASSVTFTLQNAANMGATALVTGLALYVRVVGATPTTGWVDANAAYPGVGNPTASGDPALDVAQSTATVKRVTFGASVKTGDVWIRVGIPSGSTKKLSGVS